MKNNKIGFGFIFLSDDKDINYEWIDGKFECFLDSPIIPSVGDEINFLAIFEIEKYENQKDFLSVSNQFLKDFGTFDFKVVKRTFNPFQGDEKDTVFHYYNLSVVAV